MLAVGTEDDANEMAPLAPSAVAGTTPPAGPEWRRGRLPVTHQAMKVERPLCGALDGFTLHAATRAAAMGDAGRESLLKYILRPTVAQARVTRGPDGLVRIVFKKALSDGTVAVDTAPLSLVSRLAASEPQPRFPPPSGSTCWSGPSSRSGAEVASLGLDYLMVKYLSDTVDMFVPHSC